VVVTHDVRLAQRFDARTIVLQHGHVFSDTKGGQRK